MRTGYVIAAAIVGMARRGELELMQPHGARRRLRRICGKARRNEARREGTRTEGHGRR
jgi:hypothetical protein